MTEWTGWDVDRAALALTAVLFLGIWVQVSLMHWAGGFKHKAMWGPVVATPVFAAAALAAMVSRGGAFGWVITVVLAVAVAEGLVGAALHLRGVRSQVGGFTVRNLLSGPPPVLPLAYGLVGVLGVGALVWNA